jgi:UDP-N-acetylglucosamine 2-epimerase
MKLVTIVGARPQFIKTFSVSRALAQTGKVEEILVHTGQHFDAAMSEVFFSQLGLREPDYHLGISGGGHGQMTGRMLERLEVVIEEQAPDSVLVYGDTNTTLAGALAASKLYTPVIHVEAGLRSHNRRMPEEINRVVVDHISTLLCCPTVTAVEQLNREGIERALGNGALTRSDGMSNLRNVGPDSPLVVNVGDVMLDALLHFRNIAENNSDILDRLQLSAGAYAVLTIHRAHNTSDIDSLCRLLAPVLELSVTLPIVFPAHPRTRRLLEAADEWDRLATAPGLILSEPLGYLDFLQLEANARAVLTDSGGVQKEAFFLGIPCLTLRDETEWRETVDAGRNRVVGTRPGDLAAELARVLDRAPASPDAFGRGDAGNRIANLIEAIFT